MPEWGLTTYFSLRGRFAAVTVGQFVKLAFQSIEYLVVQERLFTVVASLP